MICNKIKFETRQEALQQIKLIKRDSKRYKNGTGNKSLWVYECYTCETWHLTSKAPLKHLKKRSKKS